MKDWRSVFQTLFVVESEAATVTVTVTASVTAFATV